MNQAVCTSLGREAVHGPLLICSAHIRGKTLSMLNLFSHMLHTATHNTHLRCAQWPTGTLRLFFLLPFSSSFFSSPKLLPPSSTSSYFGLFLSFCTIASLLCFFLRSLPPSFCVSFPPFLLFLHCPFLSPFSCSLKRWY